MDIDRLTSLPGRKALLAELDQILSKVDQHCLFSVTHVNVDNFKRFNGHNGYVQGDLFLQRIATHIPLALSLKHTLYRYGGDDFIAIFPVATHDESVAAAERIRESIEQLGLKVQQPLDCGDAQCIGPTTLSASIGLVTISKSSKMTSDKIIAKLGERVLDAKIKGRNRISFESHTD